MSNGLGLGYRIYKTVQKLRPARVGGRRIRMATVSSRTFRQHPVRSMESAFGIKLGFLGKAIRGRGTLMKRRR